jgi:hypothetical protein
MRLLYLPLLLILVYKIQRGQVVIASPFLEVTACWPLQGSTVVNAMNKQIPSSVHSVIGWAS